MTCMIQLYPQPRSLQWMEGSSELTANIQVRTIGSDAARLVNKLNIEERYKAAATNFRKLSVTVVNVEHRDGLHPQGYVMEWGEGGLSLVFSAEVGLHYALVTMEQLMKRQGAQWEHFRIEDEPDFPIRGVMLDIGRNKIPQMDTLYAFIDRSAELKLNHLQLYMEGFCFDYSKFRSLFPEATPISAEEFRKLDAYAKSRYIDLVPNQNCLGHMGHWLAKPEFNGFAEHPDGMPTQAGFTIPATTLNPVDERSIALIKDLFDELLPHFSSDYVNINLDEPFGLGTGQSKERAEEIGVGKLYLEFAEQVFDIVRAHGKKILMWGDILTKHPELVSLLPDDVTVLDWNYESHTSFEEHGKLLQESGVPYYVCPGTSAWSSISGRVDNMLANIADAATNGKAYGAQGMIVTDWGDSGHWQVMAVSSPGYAYAAGLSWQTEANLHEIEQLEHYVSECVFQDRTGQIGNLLLELGRYYRMENSTLENMSYMSHLLNRGLSTREKLVAETQFMMQVLVAVGGSGGPFKLDLQYDSFLEWIAQRRNQLGKAQLAIPDAAIVVAELANAISLIEHGLGLHRYIFEIDLPAAEDRIAWLEHQKGRLKQVIEEFKRLWRLRNREGGLTASTKNLYKLLAQYDEELAKLQA